jgi:thiol-disulfide isomerase/thioredoxin
MDADKALQSVNLSIGFYVILALLIVIVIILIDRLRCKGGCGHFSRNEGCGCCEMMKVKEEVAIATKGIPPGGKVEPLYNPATNSFGWIHPGAQNTPGPITITPLIQPSTSINNTRRVTLHYTNWCGYCKQMKPVWEKVKVAAANSGIIFSEVDEDIAHTPGITGYPSIIMLNERGERSKYFGTADFDTLRNWVVSPLQRPI